MFFLPTHLKKICPKIKNGNHETQRFGLPPSSILIEGFSGRSVHWTSKFCLLLLQEAVNFWKVFPIDLHKHVHTVFQIPCDAQCLVFRHPKPTPKTTCRRDWNIRVSYSLSLPKSSETSSVNLLDFSPLVTNSNLSSLNIIEHQTPRFGIWPPPKNILLEYIPKSTKLQEIFGPGP